VRWDGNSGDAAFGNRRGRIWGGLGILGVCRNRGKKGGREQDGALSPSQGDLSVAKLKDDSGTAGSVSSGLSRGDHNRPKDAHINRWSIKSINGLKTYRVTPSRAVCSFI